MDSNEAAENVRLVESLKKAVETAVRPLPAGDYLVVGREKSALVERKTIMDFLNSLKGRLWEQLSLMRDFEGEKALVLEGYLGLYRKRGWKEVSILALMDRIVHEWRIPIIPTPDIRGTLTYLVWKNKSLGEAEEFREYPLRIKRKDMSVEEQSLFVLEGLCGHETAKALLSHFKTLRNVFLALDQNNPNSLVELSKIKVGGRRIPEKILKKMITVANACYVSDKKID
ncbi:MAG: ERCC4 domain-containing protein [Candidatus Caldarchaeum sp.]|nr:ERCC4 domain-containing protein [Candidatus Caldarchaeum sp.]